MLDRLKKILNNIIEFWKKLSIKQKSLIISVFVCTLCTIGILTFVLTRKDYKKLVECEDTKQSNEVVDLLKENQIDYKLENDSTVVYVDTKSYETAQLLLGANDIATNSDMTMEELFNNDMSTTESERKLRKPSICRVE